jgi:hypothetical protein
MRRVQAYVSVDLDTVDTHLAGYGIARPACDRVYRTSVPRILDLLDEVGVRATLFVIARDAEAEGALWRDAVRRGHEIASHSITHPLPFATLPAATLADELRTSRARLADVTGEAVVGFRAPGWDVAPDTLRAVADAGYHYDASVFPTPALLPGTLLRWALSRGAARELPALRTLRMSFGPRRPYQPLPDAPLWEFPVAVSPVIRLPLVHTLWYLLPAAVCRRVFRSVRRSRAPLSYQFHAADLLDLHGDGVDPRLGRHPGMSVPLARKRELLRSMLADIAAEYEVVPYRDALPGVAPAARLEVA